MLKVFLFKMNVLLNKMENAGMLKEYDTLWFNCMKYSFEVFIYLKYAIFQGKDFFFFKEHIQKVEKRKMKKNRKIK